MTHQISNQERPITVASVRTGRAVLRAYMAIQAQPPSTATARFPATRRAGAATNLAVRIRRHGRVPISQLERFAQAAAIDVMDLKLSLLPLLGDCGVVDIGRDREGTIAEVEELVGVGAPVLEQCSSMWEASGPSVAEGAAIEISDQCSYVPETATSVHSQLQALGVPEAEHGAILAALAAVGLIRRQHSRALGEHILYSPYVWGSEAVNIAEFMARLPPNERASLQRVARLAGDRPGTTLDAFQVEDRLLKGARKVGLLDATRVVTTGGDHKAFGFPPGLEHRFGGGSTDATHERKLFVAHIMYGHQFGYSGTGRIRDPLVLVSALINRGTVGPTTSIRTDYPLLEGHGIVRVEERADGRAYLHLVKDDVARDSLDLLRLALEGETSGGGQSPMEALWLPGALYRGPEEDRAALPEPDAGAASEVLGSTIERLREEQQRKLRGEET